MWEMLGAAMGQCLIAAVYVGTTLGLYGLAVRMSKPLYPYIVEMYRARLPYIKGKSPELPATTGTVIDVVPVVSASEDALSPDRFPDRLTFALWLHERCTRGAGLPTVRELDTIAGPVFSSGGQGTRLWTISGSAARAMIEAFAKQGLIKGRGTGQTGTWAPTNEGEVCHLLMESKARVVQKAA